MFLCRRRLNNKTQIKLTGISIVPDMSVDSEYNVSCRHVGFAQFPRQPIMTTGDDDDDTMMMCTAHQLGIQQPNFQLLHVAPTGDQISNYMQEQSKKL